MRNRREWRIRSIVTFALASAAVSGVGAQTEFPSVGLSAVRAQRFGRSALPNANADGGDQFASAFAAGDFDGDGTDDLATGAPFSDGSTATPVDRCGQVVVRYGIAGRGLDAATAPAVLGQFVAGSGNPAEAGDQFGAALAACDLNGDGFGDLVVGVPLEDIVVDFLNFTNAGIVEIYYGSSAGLPPLPSARRSENIQTERAREPSPGSGGVQFGSSLACGDFDGDGDDDLAVGLPLRDLSAGKVDAGRIYVYPGSSGGIGSSATALVLDQDTPQILDLGETNDRFGWALAAGDFDGDGRADLAVGVPGEVDESTSDVGALQVIYGSASGLSPGYNQILYHGDTPSVADSFATALAVGNFDADPYDDLVVGSGLEPTDDGPQGSGYLYSGSSLGLTGPEPFSIGTVLGIALPGIGDGFGSAVAAGDFDGDGASDLAVGSPYEDLLGSSRGAVTIVLGAAGAGLRLEPTGGRHLSHGHQGYPGDSFEDFVYWGSTLAAGDFDGDGYSDLAVGAKWEREPSAFTAPESLLSDVGTEAILYGALFADGFEADGEIWSNF